MDDIVMKKDCEVAESGNALDLFAVLAEMLGDTSFTAEQEETVLRMKARLDRFEDETKIDRTTVFCAVLEKLRTEIEKSHTLERMDILIEEIFNSVLEELNEQNCD